MTPHRAHPSRVIAFIAGLIMVVAMICALATTVTADDPTATPGVPSATVPAGSAVATAPAASSVTGTAAAPSPVAGATVATASDVAPPSIPPAVTTSGGPDSTAVIATLIGVGVGIVVVALGGWGLIRLIANAGR